MEVVDHLLARPVLRMDAGVDDEADGAEDVAFEAAVIRVRVLIEADIFAELLGVESPAFGVGGVVEVFAKSGQAGELLRDRNLEMVAGQAFVVSDGFNVGERGVLVVVGVDEDGAGTGAVGRAFFVVGGRLILRHIGGDGLDDERRFGEAGEEVGEFGAHLVEVGAVGVEERVGGGGMQFGIGSDGGAQGGDIGIAELLRDDEHPGFVLRDLVEADLMNLGGGEVGGGAALDQEGVIRVAVGERPDAGIGAACGNVDALEEFREVLVGGVDLLCDGGDDGVVDRAFGRRRRWKRGIS